jgi:hypothetical protein
MRTKNSFRQGYIAPVAELLELAAETPLAQSQIEQPIINPPINW